MVTGSLYLGGFISDQDAKSTWIDKKVKGWVELLRTLSWVDRKHSQISYAGIQKSLQQEWASVQ